MPPAGVDEAGLLHRVPRVDDGRLAEVFIGDDLRAASPTVALEEQGLAVGSDLGRAVAALGLEFLAQVPGLGPPPVLFLETDEQL